MIRRYIGAGQGIISDYYLPYIGSDFTICLYVWKSDKDGIGFNADDKGYIFVDEFLKEFQTILFPDITVLNTPEDINFYRHQFTSGISVLKSNVSLEAELRALEEHRKQTQKNLLVKRYGKDQINLEPVSITDWYHQNHFSQDFFSFAQKNNFRYLIWTYTDFRICFFHFGSPSQIISDIVDSKCSELGIEIETIYDLKTLYNWPNI